MSSMITRRIKLNREQLSEKPSEKREIRESQYITADLMKQIEILSIPNRNERGMNFPTNCKIGKAFWDVKRKRIFENVCRILYNSFTVKAIFELV